MTRLAYVHGNTGVLNQFGRVMMLLLADWFRHVDLCYYDICCCCQMEGSRSNRDNNNKGGWCCALYAEQEADDAMREEVTVRDS